MLLTLATLNFGYPLVTDDETRLAIDIFLTVGCFSMYRCSNVLLYHSVLLFTYSALAQGDENLIFGRPLFGSILPFLYFVRFFRFLWVL